MKCAVDGAFEWKKSATADILHCAQSAVLGMNPASALGFSLTHRHHLQFRISAVADFFASSAHLKPSVLAVLLKIFVAVANILLFDEIAKSKGYKRIQILRPDGSVAMATPTTVMRHRHSNRSQPFPPLCPISTGPHRPDGPGHGKLLEQPPQGMPRLRIDQRFPRLTQADQTCPPAAN